MSPPKYITHASGVMESRISETFLGDLRAKQFEQWQTEVNFYVFNDERKVAFQDITFYTYGSLDDARNATRALLTELSRRPTQEGYHCCSASYIRYRPKLLSFWGWLKDHCSGWRATEGWKSVLSIDADTKELGSGVFKETDCSRF